MPAGAAALVEPRFAANANALIPLDIFTPKSIIDRNLPPSQLLAENEEEPSELSVQESRG